MQVTLFVWYYDYEHTCTKRDLTASFVARVVCHLSTEICENRLSRFYVMLLTNKQTNKQTNKVKTKPPWQGNEKWFSKQVSQHSS